MGIATLPQFPHLFSSPAENPLLPPKPKHTPTQPVRGHKPHAKRPGSDALQAGGDRKQAVDQAFEGTVYRSAFQQAALAVRMQQVAARFAQNGEGEAEAVQVQAEQLAFDFFAQSRVEELTRFTQRTQTMASGLGGAQQTSFVQASQQVAAHFEFSMTISGAALNGFVNGAEGLQDNEGLFGEFIDLTQQFLEMADELDPRLE